MFFTNTPNLSVPVMIVMRELNMNAATQLAIPALRRPNQLAREFTAVRLLHKEVMQTAGLVVGFIHGTVSHLCLFCNFALLKNWNTMDSNTTVSTSDF